MIVIFAIENGYVIGHYPQHCAPGFVYSFHRDFIPEEIMRRLTFCNGQARTVFPLNAQQERNTNSIFRKLMREKDSGYAFSEELQRTYLIELFHLIMKVHQRVS